MDLALFFIVLILVLIIIRLSAIAFELTGMDSTVARFQAISCYTGTGFTTKEAEIVIATPQRRKIASIIMILGHVSFVSLIATFANTLRSSSDKFLNVIPGHFVPWVKVIIVCTVSFLLYKLFSSRYSGKLFAFIKARLVKRNIIKPLSFEEMMLSDSGYGLCTIEISEESPILGASVGQISEKFKDVNVLMLGKKDKSMHMVPPDTRLAPGDRILCFGKVNLMKEKMSEKEIPSQTSPVAS